MPPWFLQLSLSSKFSALSSQRSHLLSRISFYISQNLSTSIFRIESVFPCSTKRFLNMVNESHHRPAKKNLVSCFFCSHVVSILGLPLLHHLEPLMLSRSAPFVSWQQQPHKKRVHIRIFCIGYESICLIPCLLFALFLEAPFVLFVSRVNSTCSIARKMMVLFFVES